MDNSPCALCRPQLTRARCLLGTAAAANSAAQPPALVQDHGAPHARPGAPRAFEFVTGSLHPLAAPSSPTAWHSLLLLQQAAGWRLLALCVLAATALAQDASTESLSAPAIAPAAAPGAAPGGLLPSLVLQPTPVDFAMPGMPQPPRPAPAPELPPEVRALAAQGIQALFNSLAERLGSGGAGRKLKARLPSRSVGVTHRRSQDRRQAHDQSSQRSCVWLVQEVIAALAVQGTSAAST